MSKITTETKRIPLKMGNIFKVADLDERMLAPKVIDLIKCGFVYEDRVLKENLYSLENALESDEVQEGSIIITEEMQGEIDHLIAILNNHACSYIRFVY